MSTRKRSTKVLHLEDHDIQSIIKEDDEHHEELKVDLTYEQINGMPRLCIFTVEPTCVNSITIPKIEILKKSEYSVKSFRRGKKHEDVPFEDICEDLNV